MTLCEIVSKKKILLKFANRGVSKGNWNGLGGRVEQNETPEEGVVREVEEESGLKIKDLEKIGVLNFYKASRDELFARVHLFYSESFTGKLRESDEGELRWFGIDSIPYDRMWPDDEFWFPLLFKGFKFDADFVFDSKMGMVTSYTISNLAKR